MKRWDLVEAFVTVVDHGGFTPAARAGGVSPSYMSRAVRRLEDRLGVQLLHRTTRHFRLTESGQRYYEECRALLSGLEAAERAAQAMDAEPRGTVRMTCATHFGERFIAPVVNDFLLENPQVGVVLELTNRVVDVVEERLDLAIRLGVLPDSSLVSRRLAPRCLHVCASPDYVARHGRPSSPAELSRHRCLVGSTERWVFQVNGRYEERRVEGAWRCNSGPAILDAALKGLGIAQLPDYYVLGHLREGRLVELMADIRFSGGGVYAVYPGGRYPVPKVRALVDYLAQRIQRQPPWRQ